MATDPYALPGRTNSPALENMPHAGSIAEQIALHERARAMVEIYTCPSGHPGTRLSIAWLGERDWLVQLLPFHELAWGHQNLLPDGKSACARLAALAQRSGESSLLGTMLAPAISPSVVWRMSLDEDSLERFFEGHYLVGHMLFPANFAFAVHGNDGDFCTYAGPESFIREALPAERIGPAATAQVIADVEAEHGAGRMDGVIAHLRPLMLR